MQLTLRSVQGKPVGFRYLWMKRVDDFLSCHHCARCIVGPYIWEVGKHMDSRSVFIAGDEGVLFYLCGVALPFDYSKNMHLALRVVEGKEASVTSHRGQVFSVQGAEQVHFDDRAARRKFPDHGEAHLTCRNFQFMAQLFK